MSQVPLSHSTGLLLPNSALCCIEEAGEGGAKFALNISVDVADFMDALLIASSQRENVQLLGCKNILSV